MGVDYEETFSPVAMLKSIRILLSIAAYLDYKIWKMDVTIAFLNGYLEECIWNGHLEECIYLYATTRRVCSKMPREKGLQAIKVHLWT